MITVTVRVLVLFAEIGSHVAQLGFKLANDVVSDDLLSPPPTKCWDLGL